jgi:hypothetical protein
MATLYIGEVHSGALGLERMQEAGGPQVCGDFRGQEVRLNPKSKSLIAQADELDDYVVVRRKDPPKLKNRKISDRKKVAGKNRLLHQYVCRLDKQQGSRQYQDYEAKLKRIKQMATIQMMERSMHGGEFEQEGVTFDGKPLAELLLQEATEMFGEVTEQDNALEYMEALEDFETEHAETEICQANKMLKRLEGRVDPKGISRQKDFREKVRDLSIQAKFSKLFKRELATAKANLRSAHGQEIQDGYNLIPKATDLFASLAEKSSGRYEGDQARIVSNAYQQALCASTLVEVMDASFNSFGAKNIKVGLQAMLELSGIDIQSANPSRDVSYLISVRETLFKTEISSQIFDSVGKLRVDIISAYESCSKRVFGESEQYAVTKSVAKLSQQTFMSGTQLWEILETLGVGEAV